MVVDMKNAYILLAVSLFAAIAGSALAVGSSNSLSGYLSIYVPNASTQYTYSNFTMSGSSYVILHSISNQSDYLVINSSGGVYRLLTNASSISKIITAYSSSGYSSLPQFPYLQNAMNQYTSEIAQNISDCITETGGSVNVNNLQSATLACETVPVCHKVLNTFGPASPFGYGLLNFSLGYAQLETSVQRYNSLLSGINSTNAGTSVADLGGIITNIGTVASTMNQNPLFPPPADSSLASCSQSLNPEGQPWWCVAVGFCEVIPFNNTLLNNITYSQAQLAEQIPSDAQIEQYGADSASSASAYITSAEERANATIYYKFLNSSYPQYNLTVKEASSLLKGMSDANLSTSLLALQNEFGAIKANTFTVNITRESGVFSLMISNVIAQYNAENASYGSTHRTAVNDTLDSVGAQLNYQNDPVRLAIISSGLQSLDNHFGSELNSSQLGSIASQLQVIGIELQVYGAPITLAYIVKGLDGWFIDMFVAGSNATVPSKIMSAPLYAAIESIIIGAILVIIFYMLTYRRLSAKKKIRKNHKAHRAWMILFIVLAILILLYAYVTYSIAAAGNSFLPFSYFTGALKGSSSAYVALNGSSAYSNPSIVDCADAISGILKSKGKAVKVISITNYTCVANGQVSGLGINCFDSAVGKGIPVIMLSSGGSGGITYKGVYGTILYVNGSAASGASCLISQLIARKV